MIFRPGGIGRPADDRSPGAHYLHVVHMPVAGLRRRYRLDPERFDRLLAVVLLVAAELEIWLSHDAAGQRVAAAVAAPLLAGTVAIRRRHPFIAGIAAQTVVAVVFAFWSDTQILGSSVAWFCSLYALTVWTSRREFIGGAVFVVASDFAASAGAGSSVHGTGPFAIVTLVVMVLVRRVLGDRERRVELAERERDLAAREAVVEERARIARELHDAIAHDVSMMVVQAGAERRVVEGGGGAGSSGEVLGTIEQIGRGALTEMRRLVGMLRSDDGDPLAPHPGLGDLPRLVAQVREAGLPVELVVEGEPRDLPVGIELSAYRIVQEALTNAVKHAGDARASVRVRYEPDSLELEIVDDGGGSSEGAAAPGGGHGLVGMRERVALYGGRLDADRRPGGGFAVRVLLPTR
jgi:signal transduction histidine kinase